MNAHCPSFMPQKSNREQQRHLSRPSGNPKQNSSYFNGRLVVGGNDIDTLIDSKISASASSSSNSSDVAIFVATVEIQNTDIRSSQISILPFNRVNIDN